MLGIFKKTTDKEKPYVSLKELELETQKIFAYCNCKFIFLNFILIPAIPMTSSSRDIYFHTPSGNQTKL